MTDGANAGEKGEENVGKKLLELSENAKKSNDYSKLIEIFGKEAESGIYVLNIADDKKYDGSKASRNCKADIRIIMCEKLKNYDASIKTTSCSPPSIINTSNRENWVFQKGPLKDVLKYIDKFINLYREIGIRKSVKKHGVTTKPVQDIKYSEISLLLLLHPEKELIEKAYIKMLIYFIFYGTAEKPATFPANAMIHWDNKSEKIIFKNLDTYELQEEYVKNILKRTVISIRPKREGTGVQFSTNDKQKPWLIEYEYTDSGKSGKRTPVRKYGRINLQCV